MKNYSNMSTDVLFDLLEKHNDEDRRRLEDFIAMLSVLDQRKAMPDRGYPSTFEYCVKRLKLSDDEAYRRIAAARATVVRPELLAAMADGSMNLTTVTRIAPHVRRPDAPLLISRALGKTARQIDELLAPLHPISPKPDLVREVVVATPFQEEARVHFSFYGSRALRDAIDRMKQLMAHKHPFGALEHILLDVATDWLMRHDPLASYPDRKPAAPGRSSIKAEVRRGVWARDAGRCVFIGPDGVRCETRRMLELDHVVPRALGAAMRSGT
ncbi:MAG: hypothetical protein M0D55_04055 [Elusimicrobiota bacterium]|nr:MAG: hypothetical protein M0D55_04055 [Elusimicrobiota bacterium]